MHFSISTGFGPLHLSSGNGAIVLLKSRNTLQPTSRRRTPSPHVTEHADHASAMNLKIGKLIIHYVCVCVFFRFCFLFVVCASVVYC